MLDYDDLEPRKMRGRLRDWRMALGAPISSTYRVGNTVRLQPKFLLFFSLVCLLLILVYYSIITKADKTRTSKFTYRREYNATYPLTKPIEIDGVITFRIAIIADLDTNSKSKISNLWYSYLKKGYLSYTASKGLVVITWDTGEPIQLKSSYALKGRGMELSELIVYDGRLLTFDDRTGMIYEIVGDKVIPWVILVDGDGHVNKGFKSEWATIKDELLYVGSMGKEWTTPSGVYENDYPMWIKTVDIYGQVNHVNWHKQYKLLRSSIGIKWPGYMIHESGMWSHNKMDWCFLPRRCSQQSYNETRDEIKACNYMITADESFSVFSAVEITEKNPTHGFSSFKFIPGSNDEAIVALRTLEHNGKTSTYIMAFTRKGKVLMQETLVDDVKYEGVEFI